MKDKIALIYSTVDGQTLKICNEIIQVLKENNQEVDMFNINDFRGEITDYQKFVIGSSIRYGVHNKMVIEFINSNKAKLDSVKSVFFSVNLVARKEEKNQPETNPYVVKFFKKTTWKPVLVEVFAGKLDYKKYPYFDRVMIQFIMWITKGPTDINTEIEYTNWDKVRAFATGLIKL